MSQKSSPKSPRSKSPSGQNEGIESGRSSRGRVIEEMQRQLEEELENSERLLNAANSIVSESRGTRNCSRTTSGQEGSRMYDVSPEGPRSRHSSPLRSRPQSAYDDENANPLQLPSPPRSPSGCGSRGVCPGLSQRSTRAPSPDYSRPRSPYPARSVQTDVPNPVQCEDALIGPDETHYREIATSYTSHDYASRAHSNLMGTPSGNRSNFESARDLAAESRSTTTRGQASNPPSRDAFGVASGMSYSNDTGGASRVTCAMSRSGRCPEAGSMGPGLSTTTKFNFVEEGVQVGSMCRAACRRQQEEGEQGSRLRVEQSKGAVSGRGVSPGPSEGSRVRVGQPSWGVSPGPNEGSRARLGQPSWGQQGRPEHGGGRGITFSQGSRENLMRSPERSPGHGHHHHHHHHQDGGADEMIQRDDRATAALAHLSQLKRTPSCIMCGVNQGVEFLNVCCSKGGGKQRLPDVPCLRQDELNTLLKCEKQDVESAWYLASDTRKSYKKPCPKQQKAQMSVKALVKAASQKCNAENYTPLDHPDPEDISPEVAASMMFAQEKGIKMDACPKDTISHLFPDEPKPPFPEKIPRSTISIVDPNQKDREEMMEKSASVPSEGVSDSAYTRTMKEKGEELGAQKSYDVDFAIGQSKREYVLVAQKPQRFSKVQFRGGNLPAWFPGYFSAFPDEGGSMKSISSPSGLFHKAWVHTNPRNMPTSDVIVLD